MQGRCTSKGGSCGKRRKTFFNIILWSTFPFQNISHSFCLILPEVLWAEVSFDSCIKSETAWTILNDLPVFLSFNYTSSSVHSTPESTSPTGCAPSCWQISCLLLLILQDSMSKILLKSRWCDSYCFSCIISTFYPVTKGIICHNLSIMKCVGLFLLHFPFSPSASPGRFSGMGDYLSRLVHSLLLPPYLEGSHSEPAFYQLGPQHISQIFRRGRQ